MLKKIFVLIFFSFIVYANNKGAINGFIDSYGNDKGAMTSYFTSEHDSFIVTVYEVPDLAFEHSLSSAIVDTGEACSLFITINVGFNGIDIYGDTSCSITESGQDTIIFPAMEDNYTVYIRGEANLSYYFDMAAGDFSLCVIPDVQKVTVESIYVKYWDSTCNWIKENYNNYAMKSIIILGDLVDVTTTANCVQAKPGVDTLKTIGIPIIFTPGNHDYNGIGLLDSIDTYHFDRSWYSDKEWFNSYFYIGTSYVDNMFLHFTNNGINYLLIGTEYDASAEILSWSKHIIDSLSDYYTIFSTHSYMTGAGTKTNGYMWDTLEQCSNLKMVLCGHITASYDTLEVANIGQTVNEILQNYQQDTEGGRGTIRMYIFKPSRNLIDVFTYTPYFDSLTRTSLHEFSLQYSDITLDSIVNIHPITGWNTDVFIPGDTIKIYTKGMQIFGDSTKFYLNSTGSVLGTIIENKWDENNDTCWIKTPTGIPSGIYFSRYKNNNSLLSIIDGKKCEAINPGSD